MKKKFQFYEYVKIQTKRASLQEVNGKSGFVFGYAESDQGDVYTVSIEDSGICWSVTEQDIISLGKIFKREDFY